MNTVVDGADGVCHQAPCPSPLESIKSQSLFTARLPWWRGKAALTLTFLLLLVACSQQQPPSPMLPPEDGGTVIVELELQAQLAQDETTGYLIYFRKDPDLSPAYTMSWEERGRFVMQTLQAAADASQVEVRAYLDAQGADYQAFWVDNLIVVENSDLETFNRIRTDFPEIQALKALPDVILIEPDPASGKDAASPSLDLLAVVSNISHVKAPDVWAMGFTGEGITVASIDTGVRYTHQALVNQYRGNLGGGSFDHNYSWWNPYASSTAPSDSINHGSHVTGTMVGDDGGDNQIGMAPGAKWIACMGFNPDVTDSGLLECAQFMLAPWDLNKENPNPDLRPHVVNNSWGDCKRSYDSWYQGVVDAWHAAGIYPVFSAGNAGSCFYFRPPGLNTVGNPARYGNVTAVGSTGNNNGQYATHSNWGPTDNLDTVNPRGYPNVKPQVVAPGVSIRSSLRGSDTLYGSFDGTSMAAPHVAGLIALMWQAAPCLVGDYGETETIIEETATPISYPTNNGDEGPGNVPNHATGWGEINALKAVQSAEMFCGSRGTLTGQVVDVNTGSPVAGATVLVESNDFSRMRITNAQGNYSLALPVGNYSVTVSRSRYGSETANVNVSQDQVTQQNFSLPAGWLTSLPTALETTVMPGSSTTLPFTLTNSGSAPVNFSFAATTGLPTEHFEGPFPPSGWTVVNRGTSGAQCGWQRNDTVVSDNLPNPRPNFAGGDGFSAAADSDACGEATTTDSELRTPLLDLSNITTATLNFIASYRHSGASSFRVDISTDGGGSWTNLLTWNSSRSALGPGEAVSLDLAPYVGSANTIIRFRYLAGWDWWAQIDQVSIQAGVPWLSFTPASGTVGANGSVNIEATFDASGLTPGSYSASLEIAHDTPYAVAHIPVTMTLMNKVTPNFSNLSSPEITYGTPSTTLSGVISGADMGLTGSVSITLNDLTQQAEIQADGSFASDFNTGSLAVSGSPYDISYSFAGDSNFHPAEDSGTLTVTRATLTVTADDKAMTYGAASLPTFTSHITGFVSDDDESVVSGWPLSQSQYSTEATTTSPAGEYAITPDISGLSAANYNFTEEVPGTLRVNKATADIAYTGDTYLQTASSAIVTLTAKLTNIDANSPNGDLSLAQVRFEISGDSSMTLDNVAVDALGNAQTSAVLPIGNYEVRVRIEATNGYWTGSYDEQGLTVDSSSTDQRVSGGGWVVDHSSTNNKGSFAFTVTPKKNRSPGGNAVYLFRSNDGYNYKVKSSSWQGGDFSFNINRDSARASFTGRANVQKIDRITGEVVESWGNYNFTVDIFDGDQENPRQIDTYAITIRNGSGEIWHQNGTRANPLQLGGGNVKIQSK